MASSSTTVTADSDAYDHVVIASHSDQALAMLSDADDARTRHSRRHRLFAQHRLSASRPPADAEAQAGLGVVELPALAARGRRRQRCRRHLLDEPAAGHRRRQAAVRQPQPAIRARSRTDLRQVHVRASAVQCRRLCRAKTPRRNPGPASYLVLRRLDRLRFPRGRIAVRARGRGSAGCRRRRGANRRPNWRRPRSDHEQHDRRAWMRHRPMPRPRSTSAT